MIPNEIYMQHEDGTMLNFDVGLISKMTSKSRP